MARAAAVQSLEGLVWKRRSEFDFFTLLLPLTFLETLASIDDEISRPAAGAGLDDHQLAFIERSLFSLGDFSGKLREISLRFHRALVHHQICNTRRSAEEIPLAYANVSETWVELRPKLEGFDAQSQL